MAKQPDIIIALLQEGIQATRMNEAVFNRPGEHLSDPAYSDEVREATRLYRGSWVEHPLLIALAYLQGEITAKQAQRLYGPSWPRRSLDGDVRDPRAALGLAVPE